MKNFLRALVPCLLLMTAFPSFGAELSVQYSQVARSGGTPIPEGVGTFTGFGDVPAIDDNGNVVFIGGGGDDNNGEYQAGAYTFIDGNYQMVADRNTLVPGGGGATFTLFNGAERNDIDDGRVAFTAKISATEPLYGLYSNVGQADPNDLVEVVLVDGDEWSSKGDPYVDGDVVSVRGRRLIPQDHTTILLWDGWDSSSSFVDPGAGYIVSPNTQASISGDAVMFGRYMVGSSEMGISFGGIYETLAVLDSTPMPGLDGSKFKWFKYFPVVDRDGLDAAFMGGDGTISGVFKRTDGGALENVVYTATVIPGTTPIPGWGDQLFTLFPESGLSLANGQVVFLGNGINSLEGIYTDIGGNLSVIVDDDENNSIELGGQTEQITRLGFGPKSFAYTPQGYMIVFKAWFESGETAIIRATIDAPPGGGTDSFTVYKDFSDNNTASVSVSLSCGSGTVTNSPQWASEISPAVFNITGATGGTTCTAAESVPSGYSANQADCQNGDPLNGSCTIVNTLIPGSDSFTVYKDFSDNNTDSVSVSLSCSSGTVTNSPQWAAEASPAVFNITGATGGTTCTAAESVPSGYTANQTDCQNGDPLNGSCTIVNTLIPGSDSFTVYKDFSDNNPASVSVSLSCSSGTVTNSPQWAAEVSPAVFNITGASGGTTCTAAESVPSGYSANQTDCQNGDPLNGFCVIVNTPIPGSDSFTVYKDFSDNNTASVSVSLSCSSGTVTNSPQWASEASPAVFDISGAGGGATCTAAESVPSGYSANQADCQNGDPLNSSCTIVNTPIPSSDSFTVYKDFSDNNTAWVSVSLSCSSGTVTNSPQWASEISPAVFDISGAGGGATCTAAESVPSGYSANQADCQNGDPLNGSCIIVNTLIPSSDSFTVIKDFSDNNSASVSITLNCTSGTVTNNPQLASEASPAVFDISDAGGGATCTAAESVPSGYTANQTDCQNGDPLNGSCTIVNTLIQGSDTFRVYKNFDDNNPGSVSVTVSCTSGTVTNNPQPVAEIRSAVFNIVGASPGATCTATENPVPPGYTMRDYDCQNGDPLNGFCVIFNDFNPDADSFTVYKDFSDNNTASVSVSLSCSSGAVTNNPQLASEASPAVFNIEGANTGATCTAAESVPSGYTANQTDCQNGDPLNGSCTIVNTLIPGSGSFTVYKDFSDNNTASVSVSLSCSSGTVTNSPQWASEASPAVFDISGAGGGATCTAAESVPSGYTANQTDCQNGDPLNGSCIIVNTLIPGSDSFTVYKDFSDNNTASVSVSLSCSSGTVTNSPQWASETSPAVFDISGAGGGATCTAAESVPSGYTANQSDCQNGDPLNGSCTIVNNLDEVPVDDFTVYKDFSDNNTASVSVSLSCSSGTVTNNPQLASEASPAVFSIEGANTGATCTATENSVPAGYTADEADCQNGDPLNGSCTIVNTAPPGQEVVIVEDGFEDGNANGWSLNGDVGIDGILAIGQYSLRHGKSATSVLSVSTDGYEGVSVTMHLAATSLKKADGCFAEVSTNGGDSWVPVIEVGDGNDDGTFYSGTVSPDGADDNLDLQLRFSASGKGNRGYCYGDDVIVLGTLIGG